MSRPGSPRSRRRRPTLERRFHGRSGRRCTSTCSAGGISATRYIALASVVSVMLGVATMIVVNSVMAGFSDKMRDRLHGVLADVVVESYDLDGFYDSDEVMARIKQVAGDEVEAMAADDGDVRPDEVPGRRPVDHPARSRSSASAPRSGPGPATSPSSSSTASARRRQRPADSAVVRDPRVGASGTRPPGSCSSDGARERPDGRAASGSRPRRAGPRPRRDHRLRAGDDPPHRDQDGRLHRPAGHADQPGLPQGRQASPSRATTRSRSSATSRAA